MNRMNPLEFVFNLGYFTVAGAVTGTIFGPLGTSSGALVGLATGATFMIVSEVAKNIINSSAVYGNPLIPAVALTAATGATLGIAGASGIALTFGMAASLAVTITCLAITLLRIADNRML